MYKGDLHLFSGEKTKNRKKEKGYEGVLIFFIILFECHDILYRFFG